MNRNETRERLINNEDLHRQIVKRAHALWEQRGRQDGFAMHDWLQAEQELAVKARSPGEFLARKAW